MDRLVSIIIPAYNSGKYIERCLDSILAQTYRNWETWIIYSPSTDDTFPIICPYIQFPGIHIQIEPKTNCATARNAGFKSCHGGYIIFLDSDDWLEPARLEKQIACMENNSTINWCWGYVRSVSKDWLCETNTVDPTAIHGSLRGILSLMFRKSCLLALKERDGHLFNPSLPYFDDVDLFMRIRKLPHDIVPEVVTNYFLNPDGLTQTTKALHSEVTMYRILIMTGAWEYLGREARETIALLLNWLLKTDIVAKRKELLKG